MLEKLGSPEAATEVLVEWMVSGAWWFRITVVNDLLRLETAKNVSTKAERHWIMCAPEGRQACDALMVGLTKLRKQLDSERRLNGRLAERLLKLSSSIDDPTARSEAIGGLNDIEGFIRERAA